MKEFNLFLLVVLGFLISSVQGCLFFSLDACLEVPLQCHVQYGALPPYCATGPNTDGCATIMNEGVCSNQGCFWDPYIQKCFVSSRQVDLIHPCSDWTSHMFSVLGQPSLACLFHNCILNTTSNVCQSSPTFTFNNNTFPDTNSGGGGSSSVDYANYGEWKNPIVFRDSMIFQVELWVPIQFRLKQPIQPIIAIGKPQTDLEMLYFNPSKCSSLIRPFNPSPLIYQNNPRYLLSNFTSSIRNTNSFQFNNDVEGIVLSSLYDNIRVGNNTFLPLVDISTDNQFLIYTIRNNLQWFTNTLGSTCNVSQSVSLDGSTVYYDIPLLYIEASPWIANTASYRISFNQDVSASISTSITYNVQINLREAIGINGVCPPGRGQLALTIDLSYTNVFDPTISVGPEYASDIIVGAFSCLHPQIVSFIKFKCSNSRCTRRFSVLTTCMNMPISGDAFNDCSNTPIETRIADLGSSNATYPSTWIRQRYTINSKVCPETRFNDLACTLLHPPPDTPDTVDIRTIIKAYPTTFVTAPPFAIRFALLYRPTDILDKYASADLASYTLTGSPEASNRPIIPKTSNIDQFTVAFDLQNPDLRKFYRLRILLPNITFYPLDSDNRIRTDLLPATWDQVKSSIAFTPKNYASQCPGCPLLPTCVDAGCDGFSIWSGGLARLWTGVSGYSLRVLLRVDAVTSTGSNTFTPQSRQFTLNHNIDFSTLHIASLDTLKSIGHPYQNLSKEIEHEISLKRHEFHGRMLLESGTFLSPSSQQIDVTSSASLTVSSSSFSGVDGPPVCDSGYKCWSGFAKAAAILIPFLGLFVCMLCVWAKKNKNEAERLRLKLKALVPNAQETIRKPFHLGAAAIPAALTISKQKTKNTHSMAGEQQSNESSQDTIASPRQVILHIAPPLIPK